MNEYLSLQLYFNSPPDFPTLPFRLSPILPHPSTRVSKISKNKT